MRSQDFYVPSVVNYSIPIMMEKKSSIPFQNLKIKFVD